jgi:hypothetical protein
MRETQKKHIQASEGETEEREGRRRKRGTDESIAIADLAFTIHNSSRARESRELRE